MTLEKLEHFRGLATLDCLGGIALAVMTTSEILIIDISDWKILIRQKHRRDLDPSLMMKTFSKEDGRSLPGRANVVTNIFLYSRLNPLITVHQFSEDLPLSWLDTPFELPLPKHDPDLPPSSPNLGFVIIPSNVVLNGEDMITPEDNSFTTYRLQSDLSIVGDMYGTQETEVQSFAMSPFVKNTEILSPRLTTTDAEFESDDEWMPFHSNWKLDFSLVAKEVLSTQETISTDSRETRYKLLDEILARTEEFKAQFETMYSTFQFF